MNTLQLTMDNFFFANCSKTVLGMTIRFVAFFFIERRFLFVPLSPSVTLALSVVCAICENNFYYPNFAV